MVKKILFLGVSIILLINCRSGPATDSRHDGLIYWPAANAQEIELATLAAREWNTLHPRIPGTVQPIPESQSTEEVLLAAIVAFWIYLLRQPRGSVLALAGDQPQMPA